MLQRVDKAVASFLYQEAAVYQGDNKKIDDALLSALSGLSTEGLVVTCTEDSFPKREAV